MFLTKSQKGAKKEPKKGTERKQVQKDMKELQEEGVLVRKGTNRSGRWMVKEYEE